MIARCFKLAAIFLVLLPHVVSAACEQQRFLFNEGKRLFQSQQFLLSYVHFSQVRSFNCDSQLRSQAWLGYALSVDQLSEQEEVLATIRNSETASLDQSTLSALRILKTWSTGETSNELSPDQKMRWLLWSNRHHSSFTAEVAKSMLPEAKKADLVNLRINRDNGPNKSVWVGALLSAVVPGVGQAYVGNWQSGAIALVLNAITLGATIDFSNREMTFPAVASGFIFSVTYVGNIVSAANGASEYNRLASRPFDRDAKMILLPELTF